MLRINCWHWSFSSGMEPHVLTPACRQTGTWFLSGFNDPSSLPALPAGRQNFRLGASPGSSALSRKGRTSAEATLAPSSPFRPWKVKTFQGRDLAKWLCHLADIQGLTPMVSGRRRMKILHFFGVDNFFIVHSSICYARRLLLKAWSLRGLVSILNAIIERHPF